MGAATSVELLFESYRLVAESGLKLIRGDAGPDLLEAVNNLSAAGLAMVEHGAISLVPPDSFGDQDPESVQSLFTLYEKWLEVRLDPRHDTNHILYGDLGYWTHWWNQVRASQATGRLKMDIVVADDGKFDDHDWVGELDKNVISYVAENNLVSGRAIVAPKEHDSPSSEILRLARKLGFEVRILSTPMHYTLYGESVAVLRDQMVPHPQTSPGRVRAERTGDAVAHRLTNDPAVVVPLRHLFELQWSLALPWAEMVNGSNALLQLLARGLTDAQIAEASNLSVRTVSRRISEAMRAAEVSSRFEFGVRYARAELGKREHG